MPSSLASVKFRMVYLSGDILLRVGRFLPVGGKKPFFRGKTEVAKIVFAGKNLAKIDFAT